MAAFVELGFALAPAAVGLTIFIVVLALNAPADRRGRVRRLLIGLIPGAVVPAVGYPWMLRGAGPGWFFYAIPSALLIAVVCTVTSVLYLRTRTPERV